MHQGALAALGAPFRPAPHAPVAPDDLPMLRFVFQRWVLTFPLVAQASPEFFPKLQQLADEFYDRNISGSDDREEASKRRKIANRVERYVTLLFAAAILAKPPPGIAPADAEQVVELTPIDLQAITLAEQAGVKGEQDVAPLAINIIAVRTPPVLPGKKPDLSSAQFIVASSAGKGADETYVARSYADFEHLKIALQQEVGPLIWVPDLPPKDCTAFEEGSRSLGKSLSDRLLGLGIGVPSSGARSSPASGASTPTRGAHAQASSPVAREVNRQSLRAYLRDLAEIPAMRNSKALRRFLHASPIELTDAEMEDASLRIDMDARREAATAAFAEASELRAAELRSLLGKLKYEVSQPDGLTKVFSLIQTTSRLQDLPEDYRAMMGWVKMSMAASLYTTFIGSDNGPATFASFSKINFLMPYSLLSAVLKITNPAAMIKGVMNLFLAQPLGSKSLLQRMSGASLAEGTRQRQAMAQTAATRINDPLMVRKLGAYVNLSIEKRAQLKAHSQRTFLPLPVVVLASAECGPPLSPAQTERVENARVLRSKGEFTGPSTLLDDMHALMVAQLKIYDNEQLESLITEGVTADLFRDLVAMFITPLAEVYRKANASDFVGDLQAACDDLVQTVKANQDRESSSLWSSCRAALTFTRAPVHWQNPTVMMQVFQDFVGRHEESIYRFIHETQVKGQHLFGGLIDYAQQFINFLRGEGAAADASQRQGIGEVDMEALLPPKGHPQRDAILREVDVLIGHAYKAKWLREVRLRRQLAAQSGQGLEGNTFGHSVLGFNSTTVGDATETEADIEADTSPFEKGGIPDPRLLPDPDLLEIPRMMPAFLALVRSSLFISVGCAITNPPTRQSPYRDAGTADAAGAGINPGHCAFAMSATVSGASMKWTRQAPGHHTGPCGDGVAGSMREERGGGVS